MQRIIAAVTKGAEKMVSLGYEPVLVCAAPVRRFLRRMVENSLPSVVFLSFNEIDPSVSLEGEGTVSLADAS
jgi:flagellar biosynthesis protein FlhA